MSNSTTPSIQNVIVVMLENRSYDNVFGALYHKSNQDPYKTPPKGQVNLNGLSGSELNYSKACKPYKVANQTTPTQVDGKGVTFSPTSIPVIDPGEPFQDMAQQITGSRSKVKSNPYTTWPPTDKIQQDALMQGFVYNYEGKADTPNLQDIMNYFTPAQMPVSSFLANKFSVCDTWFGSLPTQTFSNRVFANCGAPGTFASSSKTFSLVDDLQYVTDMRHLVTMPSVFQALDKTPPTPKDSKANWKVYFHDYSISIMTTPYVAQIAGSKSNINISTFDNSDWGSATPHQLQSSARELPTTFLEDIENKTLPPYSLIEPRYSNTYAPTHGGVSPAPSVNSNHPGCSTYPTALDLFPKVSEDKPPIDASCGELFLMQVYNTLRNSSYWENSLLIVTYDEHGGLYDHVAPPATPASMHPVTINWINNTSPPFKNLPPAEDDLDKTCDGFTFNVYGGRVPALAISPFVSAGTTLTSNNNYPFDHSSIVRTVLDTFGLSGTSLTTRDAKAPSVLNSANVTTTNTNTAPAFSGIIVPAPSSMTFHLHALDDSQVQLLQASAGNTLLSATSNVDWLSLSSSTTDSILSTSVTANKKGLKHGPHHGTISISGDNLTTVNVPVTLVVTLL